MVQGHGSFLVYSQLNRTCQSQTQDRSRDLLGISLLLLSTFCYSLGFSVALCPLSNLYLRPSKSNIINEISSLTRTPLLYLSPRTSPIYPLSPSHFPSYLPSLSPSPHTLPFLSTPHLSLPLSPLYLLPHTSTLIYSPIPPNFLHPFPTEIPCCNPPFLPGLQTENVRAILDFSFKPQVSPSCQSPLHLHLLANPFLHLPSKYVAPPTSLSVLNSREVEPCSHNLRTIFLVS